MFVIFYYATLPNFVYYKMSVNLRQVYLGLSRLQEIFPLCVVALGQIPEFAPRSPDFTPLDYFLWEYINNCVNTTPPDTIRDPRRRISN